MLCSIVSATEGTDYMALSSPQSLTFNATSPDGDMRCTNITIDDDTLIEGDETFTVDLTVTTPDVMMGNAMTTVTITDDEG